MTDICGNWAEATFSTNKRGMELEDWINIYPNPGKGYFTISGITNSNVYLYSSLSKHIRTFENVSELISIDISDFPNGIYLVKIIDGENVINKRIILNK